MSFSFAAVRDFLRCPKSRSELVEDGDSLVSVDPNCRLKYPVRDGIPIMLVDEAEELSTDAWRSLMQKHGRNAETGALVGS